MPDILHRVGVDGSATAVFNAIATVKGLRSWWVGETTGDTGKGGVIDFGFCKMKVVQSKPGEMVQWDCISGPPEWVGTKVTFQLQRKDDQTFILFKHANWKEQVEFMHHCSTKWATFLMSLKDSIEKGSGRPTPNDVKIHVGD